MTCSERIAELVELARADGRNGRNASVPDRELRAHLAVCADCRERWDAERQLTAQFGIIRARTAALRSSDRQREALLRNFSQIHRHKAFPSKSVQTWVWALGAAAALLLAVFLGHAAGNRTRPPVRAERTVVYEASLSSNLSYDASALSNDDFIAVPYTPPLATGEMVRVVHADLNSEALASMGVEVDPTWTGELPADLVVGEDGLPRAVRITDNGQF
jgi:hypothetical protein